ncbi:MAG: RNA polymerase sigma factor [Pseudomonadota bacterium]
MDMDFNALYEKHYNKLFAAAYRLTGSEEDAEDVLQEAFLNAYRAYHEFQGKSSVSTWLYRIVVNCSYRYMKKQKHLPVVDISSQFNMSQAEFFEMLKTEESVEDVVLTNDMRESCLQLFLKCIPQKQRIAFILKVLLNLSTEEVAAIMDISEGAVKTNVYRARLSMKENMEDKCSYINPDSPCRCKNWVAFAIRTNRMDKIPRIEMQPIVNYEEIYNSEMDFLSRVVRMYSSYPQLRSYDQFISSIKGMISNHSLELFS